MINQFDGKHEALSNFSTSTPIFVVIQPGMVSHVSALEYGYQAYKSLDPGVRMLITGAPTPGKAKRIGQTVLLRPNWEQIKERVMKDLLIQKFTLNPKALEVLLGTGEEELIEGNNWHDSYWGMCSCAKCAGKGLNRLGVLLMEVRAEFRTIF